jgi:hypothetical protein
MKGYFSEETLKQFAVLAAEEFGTNFSEGETYDFARCVRPDGTAYGTKGKCRQGTEEGHLSDESYSEAKLLLEGLYDFTLCKRKDSTYYGVADGKKCRKGEEAAETREQKETLLSNVASVGPKNREALRAAFSKLTDGELEKIAEVASKVIDDNSIVRGVREKSSGAQLNFGMMSLDEMKALRTNKDKLAKADEDPSVLTGKLRKVSDNELEAFSLLTGVSFKEMGGMGLTAGRVGLREDGTYGKGSEWRGKQLLRRYLEQDGKDIYTGLPISFSNAAMEHIQSYSRVGHEKAERPENWGWTSQVINDLKAEHTFKKFIDDDVASRMKGDLNLYKKQYDEDRKSRVRAFRVKPEKLAVQSIADRIADEYAAKGKGKGHMILQHLRKPTDRGPQGMVRYGRGAGKWSDATLDGKQTFSEWIIRKWPKATESQRERIVDITQEIAKLKLTKPERMALARNKFASLGLQ